MNPNDAIANIEKLTKDRAAVMNGDNETPKNRLLKTDEAGKEMLKSIHEFALDAGLNLFPTPTKPLGHFVLVEQVEVHVMSAGGIALMTGNEEKREKGAGAIAKILAFGPIAYKGFANCRGPEEWGVKVGDIVELSGRYDGKKTRMVDYNEKFGGLRYVNDDDIIGVISEQAVNQYITSEDK